MNTCEWYSKAWRSRLLKEGMIMKPLCFYKGTTMFPKFGQINNVLFCSVVLFGLMIGKCYAEGTKSISPTSTYCTALAALPSINAGPLIGTSNSDYKIHFYISDYTKEKLYYGFNWGGWGQQARYTGSYGWGQDGTRVIMEIYNPDGTVNSDIPLGSNIAAGYIQGYSQAYNGPNIAGKNAAGYTPGIFTPNTNGEYTVLFKRQVYWDFSWHDATDEWFNSPYFDLTVAEAYNKIKTGRVYCQQWSFVAINPSTFANDILASAEPVVYPYTNDGVVYQVGFESGFEPIAFVVAMNSYGVTNTGNWATDRKSQPQSVVSGMTNCYKVFLNIPDNSIFPTATAPPAPVFASPSITGKWPGPYKIRFRLTEAGDCKFLLDMDNNGVYDANSTDRIIDVPSCVVGLNSFSWDGKDGKGNVTPKGASITIVITTQKGRTNMPLSDAEINKNGFNVATIAPVAIAHNQLYWDDSALMPITGQSSGNNNTTTGGIDNSTYGTIAPAHAWNGNGNPGQTIPAPAVNNNDLDQNPENDFGNYRVINTWFWGLSTSANSIRLVGDITISGTVWHDIDNSAAGTFTNIKTGSETGTKGGGLYAILVDPETNTVLSSTGVNADGTYTIPDCPMYGNSLSVILSTTAGTIDAAPPTAVITSGWVNTSPVTRTVTTVTSNITGVDFGVNQKPTAVGSSTTITPIPTGTNTTSVASYFGGNDPANGIISSLKITAFPTNATSITINGTNYTSATFPSGGVSVPTNATSQPTQAILIDPIGDVAVTVTIPFVVIDNGGAQSDNTANLVLNYVPQADVAVTKTVSSTAPLVGSKVIFTITAKNNGQNGATNVNVTDNIPSGYTVVSVTPSAGTSWTSPTWAIGNLSSGASAVLTIVATVNATGVYANTASVTANETDPTPGNNSSTANPVPIPATNLSVTKSVDKTNPLVGDIVIFTITANNAGPSDATGVKVTDVLSPGYSFVLATPSAGTSYDSAKGIWAIGNLANGSSATLVIKAKVL